MKEVITLSLDQLVKAEWNYKTDGTEEQIQKLMNAIVEAGSCGVLMVRELSGKHEVMDGNHRLEALRRLNWTEVQCENFGKISKAKAVVLTRQRNQNWFDDDKIKLAKLLVDDVLTEYSKIELADILPETLESLDTLELLAISDWQTIEEKPKDELGEPGEITKKVIVEVPEETFNLWLKWKERLKDLTEIDSDARAFEYAIIEAMNSPEEQWQK